MIDRMDEINDITDELFADEGADVARLRMTTLCLRRNTAFVGRMSLK